MYHNYFAATSSSYNCGAYGAGSYNENCATSQTTQATDSGPVLADTGVPVLASIVGGVLLVAVGVVLLVKMLKNKKK